MEQLDALSENLQLLLERYEALRQENCVLKAANEQQRDELIRTHAEFSELKRRFSQLEVARSLAEIPGTREDAKRRITALINQVDTALEVLKK